MRATEIAALLAQRAEEVCRHLLPNGRSTAGNWCAGSLQGEAGDSLKVGLSGARAGRWADFAGSPEERGDLLGLWKQVRCVDLGQACEEALDWLNIPDSQRHNRPPALPASQKPRRPPSEAWLALQQTLRAGTLQEINALAELRHIPSTAALELATKAGQLFFASVHDNGENHPAWIITDSSRRNAQARRMDGLPWAGIGNQKAKTIPGCEANWPVGIADADAPEILLVEGGPDLLAAWHIAWSLGLSATPVAMLGASQNIHPDSLQLFAGKTIHILPHSDDAGKKACERWSASLPGSQALTIPTKDLNDFVSVPDHDASLLFPPQDFDFQDQSPPPPDGLLHARAFLDFALPPPSDRSILLGNRYLSRGDGLILASTSGMGKSSLSLQLATSWACGLSPFGAFRPNGPLRSLIFQSEDSEGDVAEVRLSLEHAMKLDADQLALVRQNVLIVTDRIHRGASFRSELKRQIDIHKPDLVWINPLLAFIGGDVNDSTDVGQFLREQLNSLNEPASFAYVLIHHTAKPPKEKKERQWNEVMYEMAGSADLTNWARAILSLQAADKPWEFKLHLAKRGARAGATTLVPSSANANIMLPIPATHIPLRHSTDKFKVGTMELPLIHWEMSEGTGLPQHKNPGGRSAKYSLDTLLPAFPKPGEPLKTISQIHKAVQQISGISPSAFRDLVAREYERGTVIREERPNVGFVFGIR